MSINTSVLNRNNFRFVIDRIPNVEYFCRTVQLPGLSFTETIQAAGVGLDAYFPGDKLEFETLQVQFLVDEDMANFTELYNWMTSIVPLDPTNYDPAKDAETDTLNRYTSNEFLNEISDASLVVNTNKNVPNKFIRFHDIFPTSLSGVEFQSGADGEAVICDVTFRIGRYTIETKS